MKKKSILIISFIIILIIVYFSYKGFNLYYYNVNNITTQDSKNNVEQFNISNTITIKHSSVEVNEYFEYQNMKIRNDFKDYSRLDQNIENSSPKLILKNQDNNTTKSFWMGIADTYVDMLKADKTLFGIGDKRISNIDFSNVLKNNNINNDIDLFNYLSKQKDIKSNIFTSVKEMKENYTIQFMISVIMPTVDSITLINGDDEGYIFNIKNGMKEVNIIKNNKRYVFMFIDETDLNDEYLKDILSTIVIE